MFSFEIQNNQLNSVVFFYLQPSDGKGQSLTYLGCVLEGRKLLSDPKDPTPVWGCSAGSPGHLPAEDSHHRDV